MKLRADEKKYKKIPLVTTMRLPAATNRKFRLACEIANVEVFTQVDQMLSKWADQYLKDLDQKTLNILIHKKSLVNE